MKMEEWKECTIGDVCSKITSGGTPKSSNSSYYNGSIPWLNTKEINFNRIYSTEKTVTQDRFDNSSAKWIPENSVIVAMYGATAGKVAISKIDLTTNQACCNLIIDSSKADYQFVYYHLYNSYTHLSSLANGGAQQNLNANQIREYPVKLPPLPTQQKIAAILSSLDDKIELNNKINTNLEQQARALFKNWFVDCMNSTTKMSDIIDVRDGTHDSPKPQESGYLLVTSKYLEAYSINPTDANFITKEDYDKINERSKVDNGDILLSMIGTVGIVSLVIDNPVTWAIKNMGLFKTSKVEDLKYYLLNYLKSDDVRNYIEQHLAGSTQKYISLSELRNLPINIPEKNILEKFNNIVTPIYERIVNNTNEIKNLKELRDTLLPKLMNGEIEV